MTDACPTPAPLAMRARLGELEPCWIEVRCGLCNVATMVPIRMLIRQRGAGQQLGAIVSRMRCKRCGVPPSQAWLNETPHRTAATSVAPGWSVPLIGNPAGTPKN